MKQASPDELKKSFVNGLIADLPHLFASGMELGVTFGIGDADPSNVDQVWWWVSALTVVLWNWMECTQKMSK